MNKRDKIKIKNFMQEYELFRLKTNESITKRFEKFPKIIKVLYVLDKEHMDLEHINSSLRKKWDPKET